LILGDVGKGKTKLTMDIITILTRLGFSDQITVIDFAPPLIENNGVKIGGRLIDFNFQIKSIKQYLTDRFFAPRMNGKNRFEVKLLAKLNREKCERLFKKFLDNLTSILIVNDITIYYQVDGLNLIYEVARNVETFIANAYFGERIIDKFNSNISLNERKMTLKLMDLMDKVINLNELSSVKIIF